MAGMECHTISGIGGMGEGHGAVGLHPGACRRPTCSHGPAPNTHEDAVTIPSLIDFRIHAVRTGSDDAGRVDFHRMLSALIGITHPTATDVRADPGDWGIDVFVGSLVGTVSVWQSKYFYDKIGDSQKKQIRESFASAMKNAKNEGYTVETWTLCVACEVSAPERKWWDTKVKEWKRLHAGVQFDLWDAPRLRRKLMSPDAKDVWAEFYGPNRDVNEARAAATAEGGTHPAPPISLAETPSYESALFVKQMTVAGVSAIDAQRKAFFNADMLVRDVSARAMPDQLAAINEIDTTLLGNWEDAVADPDTTPNANDYQLSARKLFSTIMKQTGAVQSPVELPLRPVHTRGLMHKIVEDGRAGWVHDWHDIVQDHVIDRSDYVTADEGGAPTLVPAAVLPGVDGETI